MLTESSDIVVEGEVLTNIGYQDSNDEMIYTLHTFKVKNTLLGNNADEILIATKGGEFEGYAIQVSHVVKLSTKEKGIFFLKRHEIGFYDGLPVYSITNGDGGKFTQIRHDINRVAFNSEYDFVISNWRKFREDVAEYCGKNITIEPILTDVSLRSPSELCLKFGNINSNYSDNTIDFDVFVKSNVLGLEFAGAEIILNYPMNALGDSVVLNGNLSASKSIVTTNPSYSLFESDFSENQVLLSITNAGCGISNNFVEEYFYPLDTVFEKLVHVSVQVANWQSLLAINLDDFDVFGTANYHIANGTCPEFESVCAQGVTEIPFASCGITGFTTRVTNNTMELDTFADAWKKVLKIKGTNLFDTTAVDTIATIKIPNADNLGYLTYASNDTFHIDYWTKDSVGVILSALGAPMGSGKWTIIPNGMNFQQCSTVVEIDYALKSRYIEKEKWEYQYALLRGNYIESDNFEIEWSIDSTDMPSMKGVTDSARFENFVEVAKAAFCDWESATGIHFEYLGLIDSLPIGSVADRISILSFANLGSTNLMLTSTNADLHCNTLGFESDRTIGGRHRKILTQINSSIDWFISTNQGGIKSSEYDLYSVLLHEIGHGLGHKHAMDTDTTNLSNDSRLMYYASDKEQIKRTIDQPAIDGVDHLVLKSRLAIECYPSNQYNIDDDSNGCSTVVANLLNFSQLLRFANPVSQEMKLQITLYEKLQKIVFFDTLGKVVSIMNEPTKGNYTVSLSNFSKGVYFIVFEYKGNLYGEKLVVL